MVVVVEEVGARASQSFFVSIQHRAAAEPEQPQAAFTFTTKLLCCIDQAVKAAPLLVGLCAAAAGWLATCRCRSGPAALLDLCKMWT